MTTMSEAVSRSWLDKQMSVYVQIGILQVQCTNSFLLNPVKGACQQAVLNDTLVYERQQVSKVSKTEIYIAHTILKQESPAVADKPARRLRKV